MFVFPQFRFAASILLGVVSVTGCMWLAGPLMAQDIEPRRWSHMPTGMNYFGTAYSYTEGDIFFNPVLKIEDGQCEVHTAAFKYIRSFELLGKSARVDVAQPYQSGTWSGLLDGVPASVDREGFADSFVRFAVNLYGAPPLTGREFAEYRASTDSETIVGLGLVVQLPTGQYFDDKLINLGTNRYTFTPQFGVVRNLGKWSMEISTSASFYTDNDEFFKGSKHEEDCYLVGQGHLAYTFSPGFWVCASAGYGYGGQSTINGAEVQDIKGNLAWGLSVGIPVNRAMGFKLAYVGTRTQEATGADTDSLSLGFSVMW